MERVIVFPIEAYVRRHKHETELRHCLRMAGTVLFFYSVLSVVTIAIVELLAITIGHRHAGHFPVDLAIRVRVIVSMGLFIVINFGVFTLLGYAMRTQMETGLLQPRSICVRIA